MISAIAHLGRTGEAFLRRLRTSMGGKAVIMHHEVITIDVAMDAGQDVGKTAQGGNGAAGQAASADGPPPARYHLPDHVHWGATPGTRYNAFGTPYLLIPIRGEGTEPVFRVMRPDSPGWWIQPHARKPDAAKPDPASAADRAADEGGGDGDEQPSATTGPPPKATQANIMQRAMAWARALPARIFGAR